MFGKKNKICIGLFTSVPFLMSGVQVNAAPPPPAAVAPAQATVQNITMEMNQSYYLNVVYQIQRVAIANPKIADVRVLGACDLNIIGYTSGSTKLTVWTKSGMMLEYIVTVVPTDKSFAAAIERAIGLPGVKVEKSGDKILLRGVVRNQKEMEQAEKIAAMYVSGGAPTTTEQGTAGAVSGASSATIVNLLEMANPVQIDLEAMVLDISSSGTSNFGFQYANASDVSVNDAGGYDFTFGTVGVFNGGQNYHSVGKTFLPVDVQIQALVQKGLARVLSRPHITTLSGQKAEILIGGSIPIPKSNSNGEISIDWKDYGIKLNIEPVVDSDNNVTSKIDTEVSTLDYDHAITTTSGTYPALTKRTANAIINVPSGMTMVIGGLLNSQEGKTIKKIPLLGDIPIIGEFFKHTSKTKDKRELMILIRPRVVNETTPAAMSESMEKFYNDIGNDDAKRKDIPLNSEIDETEDNSDLTPQEVEKNGLTLNKDTNQYVDLSEGNSEGFLSEPKIEVGETKKDVRIFNKDTNQYVNADGSPIVEEEKTSLPPAVPSPESVQSEESSTENSADEDKPNTKRIFNKDTNQYEVVPEDEVKPEETPTETKEGDEKQRVNDLIRKVADKQNEVNDLIKKVADTQSAINDLIIEVAGGGKSDENK